MDEEKAVLLKQVKCYSCKESGHLSRDYPKKKEQIMLPREVLENGVYPEDMDSDPKDSDALNQCESSASVIIAPIRVSPIIDRILNANRTHLSLHELRELAKHEDDGKWKMEGDLLLRGGRLVVPDDGDLRARLLDEIHRQPSIAHPGQEKTKRMVSARYYWQNLSGDVKRYVNNCQICKRTKTWRDRAPGLLQPLPIPGRPWQHITMDFRSFPKDRHGFDNVCVFVDLLTKRPISVPCHKETDAKATARLFIDNVYRWVGLPESIVSDRGGQFVSEFWKEFCRNLGIERRLSTAYHPQTDGQIEIANQYMAQRLRPFVNHCQDNWSEYLPMVDFAAAALPQETTGVSPFFVERGYEPHVSFDWETPAECDWLSQVSPRLRESLDPQAQEARVYTSRLQDIWEETQQRATRAQSRQQQQANQHRREEDFGVGDLVYVTTRNWRTDQPGRKLANQASGPYRIVEKIGHSYRLDLPDSIRVHPIFAPEKLLKATLMEPLPGQIVDPTPPVEVNGDTEWEAEEIIAVRLHYRKFQYKAKWIGSEDDNWYPASDFKNAPEKLIEFHRRYPDLPGPPKRLNGNFSDPSTVIAGKIRLGMNGNLRRPRTRYCYRGRMFQIRLEFLPLDRV
ncbi:Retrovirus polyprotein [Penicillium argentinense]|uniref:Retrovirus polyprotein n=1 Tax=Penicillium argentinense TaxID=1131581 RepID=A0A9W9KBV3_9EURO|nr:Retrovirus polyprotein [Penicillium argentinense]KAJ5099347.1 Retrovirus polyprotein [Penicillium argentinense]